jgi:hypothetical protein
MRIYTDNSIEINNLETGLKVAQDHMHTKVYSCTIKNGYVEYQMPHQRYSLAHDKPSTNLPGREQFEKDIINLMKSINND